MDWTGCVVDGIPTLRCVPIIFNNVVTWALIFAGVVAVFLIVISGFKYINSGGDPKQVEGARGTLTWAIVGLIIILLSFFALNFISDVVNVECIKSFGFDTCTPGGFAP